MPKSSVNFVVTADQIGSRQSHDGVPDALKRLALIVDDTASSRAFVRTAGDEIQALISDAAELIASLEALAQLGHWRVGVGLGKVAHPLADDLRAATGEAFFAAREAIGEARTAPQRIAVRTHDERLRDDVADLRAALVLLHSAWARRSDAGWEVATLAHEGLGTGEIAQRLGVTASAVSQRLKSALVDESEMGKRLCERLAARLCS